MKLFDALLPFKSPPSDKSFDLSGKKALIVTSSQSTLDYRDKKGRIKRGKATGVHASELTEPYDVFEKAGLSITIASIKGGRIPLDPFSIRPLIRTEADKRLISSVYFLDQIQKSKAVMDVNASDYDLIFISGGYAAAYDLEQSKELADLVSEFYSQNKVIATVCHGVLGICSALKPDGTKLIDGLHITGVSNRQLKQLGIYFTPKHPETSIKQAGGHYKSERKLLDLFASHVQIEREHKIVTGQNQKSGIDTANAALSLL